MFITPAYQGIKNYPVGNYVNAFINFKEAATAGHRIAQFKVASMYLFAQGTEKDTKQALFWYLKSADAGIKEAQYNAGVILYDEKDGVQQDYIQASLLFRKAASNNYALAQNYLGYMYKCGYGTERDCKQALTFLKNAFNGGCVAAAVNIGHLFRERGSGVQIDYDKLLSWLMVVVDKGDPTATGLAQSNIGCAYQKGLCVTRDYVEAMKLVSEICYQ
jgi:TPR repeat protein